MERNIQNDLHQIIHREKWGVVSHIPKFGDASKSPAGDAASPARDVVASPNFGVCDTAENGECKYDRSIGNEGIFCRILTLISFFDCCSFCDRILVVIVFVLFIFGLNLSSSDASVPFVDR
jgi:hypothetical protein